MKSKDPLKEYLLNSEEDQFNLLAPNSYWAALILGLFLTASLFILVEKSKVTSWEKLEGVIKNKNLIETKLEEQLIVEGTQYKLKGTYLKIKGQLYFIKDVSSISSNDSSSKKAFITLKENIFIPPKFESESGPRSIQFEIRKESTSLKKLFLRPFQKWLKGGF